MMYKTSELLTATTYPIVMSVGMALHLWLLDAGTPLALATYLPAVLGAALVTFMEWYHPERERWKPGAADITNDLLYMVLIQVLLPLGLAPLAMVALVDPVNALAPGLHALWPNEWPVPAQAALMLFGADFLRYWLHRAAHTYALLWRLHAVHHSPDKLYWLNVGRFHPIEKALQFVFDTLPFMLVGVASEVVAMYFVFYSINGFFQHCNIKLRFGFLNYVISSAELHRWHHSRLPRESNNNYGNNVIVWDWLFGTRYLPDTAQVGPLGLLDDTYPMSFSAQIKAPFERSGGARK